VKTILAQKFDNPAQRWGTVGLGKGGVGWNPRPPLFLLSPWLPSPPLQGQGEGRRKGGGKEEGDLEEGMHGFDPCTTPFLGYPLKLLLKLYDFSISFGDFCEILLYLKRKWSSLGSPLGFSFYENLTTIKKKQEWQIQCQCFVPPPLQKMFSL
jgi:hypothetical protein